MADVTTVNLLTIVQVEHRGIKVHIELDRLKKTVSLVEYDRNTGKFKPKKWEFVGRELKYMNGWLAILEAMTKAIELGKVELERYGDEDTQELIKIFVALDDIKNVKEVS